jgi:hypothetical protein
LKAADIEWKGMILCGAYTGMRLGDVSLLKWENVDLSARELRFKTEKTGREMIVPIAEALHRHLVEIAGNDDPRAPLFPRAFATRQRDIPTGTLSNQFYRVMVKAGVVEKRSHKKKKDGPGRDGQRSTGGLGFHCGPSWRRQGLASDALLVVRGQNWARPAHLEEREKRDCEPRSRYWQAVQAADCWVNHPTELYRPRAPEPVHARAPAAHLEPGQAALV